MTTTPLSDCGGQSEVVSGALFIRKVRLTHAGDRVGGHAHHFDHTTIFLRGRVRVSTFDPRCECRHEYIASAGDHMLIDAAVIHELTALDEDGAEFWCVFPHRNAAGDIVNAPDDPRAHLTR